MEGKNCVQLVGYVGQDLKQKKCGHGLRVAIRMATHNYMTDGKDGKLYKTTWHNVVAWDGQAEYALSNLVKGSRLLVEGRLVYGNFKGRDGQKHSVVQIRANALLNLDR